MLRARGGDRIEGQLLPGDARFFLIWIQSGSVSRNATSRCNNP
ncbi:hypothetical protein SAMN04488087_2409 [Rhodothermus profundi]|uniref:Uncharacterized protein n=1 Tax=Rhodothermus profundi TaxID=633813 RepID=A0A1M6WS60_9BACT|nr:hypothetical protein SAMN04488087_2409 [Rhodothermus profundi]